MYHSQGAYICYQVELIGCRSLLGMSCTAAAHLGQLICFQSAAKAPISAGKDALVAVYRFGNVTKPSLIYSQM